MSIQARGVRRRAPDLCLKERLERPSTLGRVEVQRDDDVVRFIHWPHDAFGGDSGITAHLGESAERRPPGREVGNGMFDVQGDHVSTVRPVGGGAHPRYLGSRRF